MRFLIVKTSSLGDIIHAFGALAYLRERFPKPHHQIDWVVENQFSELVRTHPDIDQTLIVQSKEWRKCRNLNSLREFRKTLRSHTYDAVFDLQGNVKSGIITIQTKSPHKVGFGFKTVREWLNPLFTNRHFDPPHGQNIRADYLSILKQYFQDKTPNEIDVRVQLNITEEQKRAVQAILARQSSPRVLVCPGSAWRNKQLHPEALINLLQRLQPCSLLFIWGNSEEKNLAIELQNHFPTSTVVDRLPLPALQNLMSHMELVVSMDSLPLHLAGTTGVPTLSVFGPSSSQKYKPCGSQHFAYQGSCPYKKEFPMRCKILRTCSTGLCMRQLTGHEVFQSYNQH